jgi:hypothetical protein
MAGVHYQGRLTMNEYTLKVYLMTATENPEDHNVALNRIKHFVYNEMESTIFINSEDVEECQKLVDAGLNITTIPAEPVDQLIGIMLFHKITAITEGKLIIGEVEISSMMSDGIVYLHGENENVNDIEIPDWWTTSDLVHCDPELLDNEKVVTMHKSSVWRDLDLQWPDIVDDTPDDEYGNTVVFADFKKLDDKQ